MYTRCDLYLFALAKDKQSERNPTHQPNVLDRQVRVQYRQVRVQYRQIYTLSLYCSNDNRKKVTFRDQNMG